MCLHCLHCLSAGAGAILQARVGCLVYGARNPRLGADGSYVSLLRPSSPPKLKQPKQKVVIPKPSTLPGKRNNTRLAQGNQEDVPITEHTSMAEERQCGTSYKDMETGTCGLKEEHELMDNMSNPTGDSEATEEAKAHPYHILQVRSGVLEKECAQVIREFFKGRRAENLNSRLSQLG